MVPPVQRQRVVVAGSGIVGLSIAFRLVRSGYDVTCLDDGRPGIASYAALGYIAPPSITSVPPEVVLFGGEAYRRFLNFVNDLEAASGARPFIAENGYMHVAVTDDQVREIDTICESWDTAGLRYTRMSGDTARQHEPMLASVVRAALIMRDAMSVNPRELTQLLRGMLANLGVEMRMNASVRALDVAGGACSGVFVEDGRIEADWVIVSAGSWTNSVLGDLRINSVIPTKGQVALLRSRGGPVLQYPVSSSNDLDMMPRPEGHLLIGTSNEDMGYDTSATAYVLSGIFNRALEVVPAIGQYEFVRTYAGLRPCTADRRPIIGQHDACPNVIVATGHCQNGVLMSPLTADAVLDIVSGRQEGEALAMCKGLSVASSL